MLLSYPDGVFSIEFSGLNYKKIWFKVNCFCFQAGTDDFRTLSAIYSQLGNAYFYMGDYVKAMQVWYNFIKAQSDVNTMLDGSTYPGHKMPF